jgi:predicted GTPase/uncharacterized protein (DUF697 family)
LDSSTDQGQTVGGLGFFTAQQYDLSEKLSPQKPVHFPFVSSKAPTRLSDNPDETSHIPLMRDISKAKVLVFGRRGAGKSSLANRLLNHRGREVTTGEPCQEPFMKCSVPDIPVQFYDGPGLEARNWAEALKQLDAEVRKANKSLEERDHYAVVLMAVNSRTQRFLQEDIYLAKKVVEEWKVPLAIVLTNFERAPAEYEKEPDDDLVVSIKKNFEKEAPMFSKVRYFSVNSTMEEDSDKPVAGFVRLARELKELVDEGREESRMRVQRLTRAKIWQLETDKIVREASSKTGGLSGGLFFLPLSSTVANAVVPKTMVRDLLELFEVEGNHKELAELFIEKLRNGWRTAGLVAADVLKVIPVVGWLAGGLGAGLGCHFQTKDLGEAVTKILTKLAKEQSRVTANQIKEELSRKCS